MSDRGYRSSGRIGTQQHQSLIQMSARAGDPEIRDRILKPRLNEPHMSLARPLPPQPATRPASESWA